MPNKNDPTVSFRIDKRDKDRIKQLAKKCGLSQTEYIKQRALGYEPRAIPPDALFLLLEKVGELENKSSSEELNDKIKNLTKEISNELLLPGKERDTLWQS
jgi:hypothetical protein